MTVIGLGWRADGKTGGVKQMVKRNGFEPRYVEEDLVISLASKRTGKRLFEF